MADEVTDFPLFPLELVALPGELVPLHIFEERYKTMMGECLERGHEFGIVWMADDGLREIGCACAIERVLEQHGRRAHEPAGPRHAAVPGARAPGPPRLPGRRRASSSRTASTSPTPKLAGDARAAYADLVKRATDREPEDAESWRRWAPTTMAATVDFGLDAKQGLLDLRSENARLRAGHAAVPRRDQAPGLRRPRPGAGAVQRQGPLRLPRKSDG